MEELWEGGREAALWRPQRGGEGRGRQGVGLEDGKISAVYIPRWFSALYIPRWVSALIIPRWVLGLEYTPLMPKEVLWVVPWL